MGKERVSRKRGLFSYSIGFRGNERWDVGRGIRRVSRGPFGTICEVKVDMIHDAKKAVGSLEWPKPWERADQPERLRDPTF